MNIESSTSWINTFVKKLNFYSESKKKKKRLNKWSGIQLPTITDTLFKYKLSTGLKFSTTNKENIYIYYCQQNCQGIGAREKLMLF